MQESAGDVKEPDVKFLSEAGFGASKAPMTDELISTLEKLIDAVTVSVHSVQGSTQLCSNRLLAPHLPQCRR